jgi:transcriptional accessory protein Tex/SPT6
VFALGDAVKVEVQSVSVVRRKVDFALAGHAAREHARPERGHDRRARQGREARTETRADRRGAKRVHAAADKKRHGAGKRRGKPRR